MIHHVCKVPLDWSAGISIFVFGDRQEGSSGYRREAWEEFEHEFKHTKNAWALGLGDYGEMFRPTMRNELTKTLYKDDSARSMIDREMRVAHDKIIDHMEFLKGRIIGLHEGHHNWKFASGENTDQRLCSALKAPFLGWTASTRLVLVKDCKKGDGYVYTMLSTHGNANGRKVHSALAWLEANYSSAWIADHYIMGHGCKNANETPFRRSVVRRQGPPGVDTQIPRLLVVGGFAEGYTDGWESDYVERAGFSPQPMGYGLIKITRSKKKDYCLARGIKSRGTCTLAIDQMNRIISL